MAMEIEGWAIDAFGALSDAEHRGVNSGLSVIYGPNEAGKSTLRHFVLGVLFLLGQFVVWWQILGSGQLMRNNPHSSFFFILSGMHGVHILVGLGGLGALLYRTHEPASGPRWQMHTRVLANAVAIFWHYLDGLWVVLFALLLLVRR